MLKRKTVCAAASRCLLFLLFAGTLRAQTTGQQDSVRLNLQQVEQQFLQKNLSLLAQQYNIDVAKALVIQARLWPNPNMNVVQGAYNTETHKWFQTGQSGEEAVQLQQLVLLAGKINKQVRIAQTNVVLAGYNFFDLMRTLK